MSDGFYKPGDVKYTHRKLPNCLQLMSRTVCIMYRLKAKFPAYILCIISLRFYKPIVYHTVCIGVEIEIF